MMQLRASKNSMLKLIRENRNLIGLVIPMPTGKELQFRRTSDGTSVLSWRKWGQSYRFVLKNTIFRPILIIEIYDDGRLAAQDVLTLDREDLRKRNILVDGEEES